MSSLTVFVFFTLSAASRSGTYKTGSKRERFYNYYMLGIQGKEGEYAFAVQICSYSLSVHDTIANEKIVLVIGPITFTKEQAFIDVSILILISGSPVDPKYEETVLNLPYPYFVGVGNVVEKETTSSTESSSCICINVSDYVKDNYMSSSVWYVYSLISLLRKITSSKI